ncbi:hypothetical protein ACSQ67_017199 [Phaseolus vulgaris]
MEAIQSWVSNHKLGTLGGLWASGIGASLVANSRTGLHAQALTLAVLSGAAAYRYYEIRAFGPKPQAHVPSPTVAQLAEWELLTPF